MGYVVAASSPCKKLCLIPMHKEMYWYFLCPNDNFNIQMKGKIVGYTYIMTMKKRQKKTIYHPPCSSLYLILI